MQGWQYGKGLISLGPIFRRVVYVFGKWERAHSHVFFLLESHIVMYGTLRVWFLSRWIKNSVLILFTFWGQEMGKGFLDPPLYQAHIQVVLSLNLKLFIKFRVFNWIYTSWVLSDRLTHLYMSNGFLFLIGIMEKEHLPSIGKHACKAKLAQLECCNNTPKAACKTFAWAHDFLLLIQDVVDCEKSLIFFWATIDGEHGKSRAR